MIPFHPLADIFPLIEGQDFDDLVRDIAQHGLREPIVLLGRTILDGRNRYRACVAAKVLPESLDEVTVTQLKHFKHFVPMGAPEPSHEDLVSFVLSKNLHRRQLDESQRGMVAANIATMRQGERTDINPSANLQKVAQNQAAERVNVSPRTVADAVKVRREAVPELRHAVEQGHIAVSVAAKATALPESDQREIAEKAFAGDANAARSHVKEKTRSDKEKQLGEKQSSLPVKAGFGWDRQPSNMALNVGKAAEHLVCADALMRGYEAFLSGQGAPYDVVIEKEGRLFRVQVKGAQAPRNVNSSGLNERIAYSFCALRRGKDGEGPRLTKHEADIVACVALDTLQIAYFPVFDCSSTIQLEPHSITENGYVRTYERPIGEYPLEKAIARVIAENHYIELQKTFPPFPRKRYGVVLADPPWSFSTYSENGMDRSADNHYPTVDVDTLCGVGPFVPAADDCVLFLWATVPMLPQALKVMKAWGFDYKSNFAWVKDRIGTGYWFRNQHELLLVGTTGNIPAPAMGTQFSSVLEHAVGDHSQKPDAVYLMIESYFPTLPKIELNARRGREGWDVWGNEAPKGEQAA